MSHEATIRQYYRAFREVDKELLRATLTPELHHRSEFGTFSNRDEMIETIWPSVGRSWAEDLEIFSACPRYMVRYRVTGEGMSGRLMAEFIRFEGDRIAEIEVYSGRELEGGSGGS